MKTFSIHLNLLSEGILQACWSRHILIPTSTPGSLGSLGYPRFRSSAGRLQVGIKHAELAKSRKFYRNLLGLISCVGLDNRETVGVASAYPTPNDKRSCGAKAPRSLEVLTSWFTAHRKGPNHEPSTVPTSLRSSFLGWFGNWNSRTTLVREIQFPHEQEVFLIVVED